MLTWMAQVHSEALGRDGPCCRCLLTQLPLELAGQRCVTSATSRPLPGGPAQRRVGRKSVLSARIWSVGS